MARTQAITWISTISLPPPERLRCERQGENAWCDSFRSVTMRGQSRTMHVSVSRESNVPIREQLTAQLIFLIGSGQLKRDTLPSVRELALRLHVHRNTVSQAYADPSLIRCLRRFQGDG